MDGSGGGGPDGRIGDSMTGGSIRGRPLDWGYQCKGS